MCQVLTNNVLSPDKQCVKSWQTMCQVLINNVSSPDKQCVKSWQTMCQVLTNNVSSPDKQCVKSWQTMCQVLTNNVSSPDKQCVKSWQTMRQVLTNNASSSDKQCVKSWQTMCQVLTNNVSSPDKQCVKSWQCFFNSFNASSEDVANIIWQLVNCHNGICCVTFTFCLPYLTHLIYCIVLILFEVYIMNAYFCRGSPYSSSVYAMSKIWILIFRLCLYLSCYDFTVAYLHFSYLWYHMIRTS